MTRLFLRFYVGVVAILVAAWLIQVWVNNADRYAVQNAQVVRNALYGGVRLAVKKFNAAQTDEERVQAFREIEADFDYPIHFLADRWEEADEDIVLGPGFIAARVQNDHALVFGPLPEFIRPGQTEQLTGFGAVLLLSALAIALLLRPVIRQFRQIESAATAIAGGDLSARVPPKFSRTSPDLADAFNNMAQRTEAMLVAQRELLQSVSHELRTPLARIHFAVDLIRTGDEQQREERLQSLESATDDLDSLVGELLTYARIESQPNREVTKFPVLQILDGLVKKFSPHHPHIQFTVSPDLRNENPWLLADSARFERAMSNLIANAARHCRSQVAIGATQEKQRLTISIDDDGNGIEATERSRVLQPFVRLSTDNEGVGLGLSIVRRIVEKHGGTVTIDSAPLGGCRVATTWTVEKDEG